MRNHAMPAIRVTTAVLALGLIAAGCGGDTGSDTAGEEHTHAAQSVTRWTDSLELFMEHPPQVAGEAGGAWGVHLTLLDGFRPVRQGELLLRFISADGASHTARAAGPSSPGIYTPAPVVPEPGTWELELHLTREGGRSLTVPAGSLRVYAAADSIPHQEEAAAGGGISYLKEQQWEVPFSVAEARMRPVPRSVEVTGELESPPDRTAKISAPVSGIVVADPAVPLPSVGTAVERGGALTVLAPTGSESSYASLHARVERLERQVARERRLVEAEAIPEKRLVESRHDLRVARAALDAVGGSSTVTRSASSGAGSENGGGEETSYRFRVRSPIGGVVAERSVAPGQRVEAGERLITVVDPSTLRLRLQVPARKVPRATPATGATFRVEGGDEVHRAGRVVSVGSVLDPDTRTLPVLLSVPNPDRELKVGMMTTARLFAGDTVRGTAVPSSAIQEEEDLHVAYVQTGGESFERRVLELGPTDGRWTVVRSGISPGEHVVTRGAYQVRLASEGTGSDAAAHGHPH